MNQIFSFQERFKDKILAGVKVLTTRIETPFRLKCTIGDKMYLYTGIRTKEANKFAEAYCVKRFKWNQAMLLNPFHVLEGTAPTGTDWEAFSRREGFDDLLELIEFFCRPRYQFKDLITYQFRLLK